MKLYQIQFDGEYYWAEAPNLGSAVAVWREHVRKAWGCDWTGEEEPESITMIHDGNDEVAVLKFDPENARHIVPVRIG